MKHHVAIITPIYATPENERLELFRYTINSVVNQDSDFKIIYLVVDDGSSSDVEGFIRDFARSVEQKKTKIRYVKRDRKPEEICTPSYARNLGIELILRGEILTREEENNIYGITFLDSDDLLPKEGINTRAKDLKKGFTRSDIAICNRKGKVLNVIKASKNGFPRNHLTLFFDIDFLRYLKDYVGEKYEQDGIFAPYAFGEDLDAHLSAVEAARYGGFEINYIPNVSLYYVKHSKSITNDYMPNNCKEEISRIFEKHKIQESKNLEAFLKSFLPKKIRKIAREVRDRFNNLKFNLLYYDLKNELEEELEDLLIL
ncbi:MAG: glycosyltransferase family A protein [Candidatus Aenigmatarchaeota archaeon]|nr:glycosyltransferase family 2 protein [Candidatus Aenigmarchaeota archaeon]